MKIIISFILFLLFIILGCSEPKKGVADFSHNNEILLLSPMTVISGESYPQNLFVGTKSNTKKVGLYDSNQNEILPMKYEEIFSGFMNPHYVVVVEARLQGLFDVLGRKVCESRYSGFILSPSDPTIIGAYIGKEEKWRVINDQGENVFLEDYSKIEFLQNDLVILQNQVQKSCLASINGTFITQFQFDLLKGLDERRRKEKWYTENDIVATAMKELQTIYINSVGNIVEK